LGSEQRKITKKQGFILFFMGDFGIEITLTIDASRIGILLHVIEAKVLEIHGFKHAFLKRNARSIANHGIGAALGADRRNTAFIIDPILNLTSAINLAAEKATALIGFHDFDFVIGRVLFDFF